MRITERHHAKASEHGDTRIRTHRLVHHGLEGREQILFIDAELARALKVIRKYIQ